MTDNHEKAEAKLAERDELGRRVREIWVSWAQMQPAPKPSWLAPYDKLSDADQEVDRQIGEGIAMLARDEGVDFVFDALASALGIETWVPEDGSETWEGDVTATLYRILAVADVWNDETGLIAHTRDTAALQEAVETLRYCESKWAEERGTMIDTIQNLREALRPFANIEPSSLSNPDGSGNEAYGVHLGIVTGSWDFTGKDLARARAALSPEPAQTASIEPSGNSGELPVGATRGRSAHTATGGAGEAASPAAIVGLAGDAIRQRLKEEAAIAVAVAHGALPLEWTDDDDEPEADWIGGRYWVRERGGLFELRVEYAGGTSMFQKLIGAYADVDTAKARAEADHQGRVAPWLYAQSLPNPPAVTEALMIICAVAATTTKQYREEGRRVLADQIDTALAALQSGASPSPEVRE